MSKEKSEMTTMLELTGCPEALSSPRHQGEERSFDVSPHAFRKRDLSCGSSGLQRRAQCLQSQSPHISGEVCLVNELPETGNSLSPQSTSPVPPPWEAFPDALRLCSCLPGALCASGIPVLGALVIVCPAGSFPGRPNRHSVNAF